MPTQNILEQEEEKEEIKSRDKSKLYFFIIALIALLATNLYFFIKYKASDEKLYTTSLQVESVHIELDRLEAELDNLLIREVEENREVIVLEQEVRERISKIRDSLNEGKLSDKDLQIAREDLSKVREEVTVLKEETLGLRMQNELLQRENERLNRQMRQQQAHIQDLSGKSDELAMKREELETKVNVASRLKISSLQLTGIRISKKGDVSHSDRAKRIDQLEIGFTLADNEVSLKGNKEVYIRVVDPKGNLIAYPENIFYVQGEKLQYTQKEEISFTNNGEEYHFTWIDPQGFRKGAYTVLLYSDNSIMGRSSVVFR